MTEEERRRLAQAATPGPWEAVKDGDEGICQEVVARLGFMDGYLVVTSNGLAGDAEDAEHIAACDPATIRHDLLEARRELDEAQAALIGAYEMADTARYKRDYAVLNVAIARIEILGADVTERRARVAALEAERAR